MNKLALGLTMGLLTMAMAGGQARADKPVPDKPGEMAPATKPAAAAAAPMAKDKKAMNGAAAAGKNTKPGKMMCEEFLSLDEVMKPKIVYWAEGFTKKGKPEDAVFDVESTDRLVPTLVEVCQKEPKASFMKKVKTESKKAP